MSQFVESVRRLYLSGYLDKEKIMDLYKNGKLIIDEVNYVLDAQ